MAFSQLPAEIRSNCRLQLRTIAEILRHPYLVSSGIPRRAGQYTHASECHGHQWQRLLC